MVLEVRRFMQGFETEEASNQIIYLAFFYVNKYKRGHERKFNSFNLTI